MINLAIPGTDGEFHVKTAHVAGMPYVAVKVASGFYDNPKRGLPTGTGLMVLFDAATGMPAALLLDNGYLTDVRTGAAGAVAAEVLARNDIATVGVIGSGVQARHQVRCLREVRAFDRVVAWSIDPAGLAPTPSEMRDDARHRGRRGRFARTSRAARRIWSSPRRPRASQSSRAAWLRPGPAHHGRRRRTARASRSSRPACSRRPTSGGRSAQPVPPPRANCSTRSAAGLFGDERVHAELGEVVAGRKARRTSDAQITVADLTGVGFQDTAIACRAFDRVVARRRA